MARTTDPVCKLCRREGVKLFLKGTRCEGPKCAIDRRNVAPGMHGYRRGKPSEYGIRLREKQKLKRFYGLLERQFRRYFELASRSTENTGEQLLTIMERRLDNVVHRLGWCPNRASARQLVTHGQVEVNGHSCNIPSMLLRPGDTIRLKNRPRSLAARPAQHAGEPAAGARLPRAHRDRAARGPGVPPAHPAGRGPAHSGHP